MLHYSSKTCFSHQCHSFPFLPSRHETIFKLGVLYYEHKSSSTMVWVVMSCYTYFQCNNLKCKSCQELSTTFSMSPVLQGQGSSGCFIQNLQFCYLLKWLSPTLTHKRFIWIHHLQNTSPKGVSSTFTCHLMSWIGDLFHSNQYSTFI